MSDQETDHNSEDHDCNDNCTSESDRKRVKFATIKVEPQQLEANQTESESSEKCSICWTEPPVNAIRLDCNHIFCFLCVKSVASKTKRCALCRAEIEADFDFGRFDIVGSPKLPEPGRDGNIWFYEGKTGWWLYDADTNKELEDAYQRGLKRVEKLIAGQVYVIHLVKMKQYQKSDESRSRQVRRGSLGMQDVLGLAGIRDKKILDTMRSSQANLTSNKATSDLHDDSPEDLRF